MNESFRVFLGKSAVLIAVVACVCITVALAQLAGNMGSTFVQWTGWPAAIGKLPVAAVYLVALPAILGGMLWLPKKLRLPAETPSDF